MSEMTPEERRLYNRAEFARKYGRYWLVYLALLGTGILSGISGMIMPMQAEMNVTIFTLAAGLYYAIGFLTNGEGAFYFWFDKLVDHDKDNTAQQIVAYSMLAIAVATILTTALACANFIAFVVGALSEFQQIPGWAQEWVVFAIPALWVAHLVAGMLFKSLSDEAAAERNSRAIIRNAQQAIYKDKADAKAAYWKQNAPRVAKQLGEMEAEDEIEQMAMRLKGRQNVTRDTQRPQNSTQMRPAVANALEGEKPAKLDENPTPGGK